MNNLGGIDWNGNGQTDALDSYVDMEISESDRTESPSTGGGAGHPAKQTKAKEIKGISMGGVPVYDSSKDSAALVIFKSIVVVVLCICGIAVPIAADLGTGGTLLCLFAAIGLSILALRNV